MTIAELGSLGEFVASIAVLVTLMFLVFQMRQNTKTMEIATSTAVMQNWVQIALEQTQNDDLADILLRVRVEDISNLSPKDLGKLGAFLNATFRTVELSYLHWIDGHLDDRIWEGHQKGLRLFVTNPGMQRIWQENLRDHCSNEFRAFVDDMIGAPQAAQ